MSSKKKQNAAIATFDWSALAESDQTTLMGYTEGYFNAEKAGHDAIVAMGDFIERGFEQYEGVYTQWVTLVLGISPDKALNLRNYAKKFRDVPQDAARRFHNGAAYSLSGAGVGDDAREWATNHAGGLPPGEPFDLELAQIARDSYVRERYDAGTLTKGQGAKLALELLKLKEEHSALYTFVTAELKASHAEVVRYIVQAYQDKTTRSTWTDLQGDQWCFRWVGKNNRERIVPVTDMTPQELEDGYKAYRQWMAIEAKEAAAAAARAAQLVEYDLIVNETDFTRKGQTLSFKLPDGLPKDAQFNISVHVTYKRKTESE